MVAPRSPARSRRREEVEAEEGVGEGDGATRHDALVDAGVRQRKLRKTAKYSSIAFCDTTWSSICVDNILARTP